MQRTDNDSFKGKIAKNARQQKEAKRAQYEQDRQDQTRWYKHPYQFPSREEILLTEFRRLPIIEYLPLTQAAASVYPVLCCESMFEGYAHIGQDNISRKCGRSLMTVRKGIQDLASQMFQGRPVIQSTKYTVHTVHLLKYDVAFITQKMNDHPDKFWQNKMFYFYTSVIKSGAWGALQTWRAHVTYLTLRSLAKSYPALYADKEGVQIGDFANEYGDDENRRQHYDERHWDAYAGTNAELARAAGITQPFLDVVLDDLAAGGLVEWYDGFLLVYRQPTWLVQDDEPPPRVRKYLHTMMVKET